MGNLQNYPGISIINFIFYILLYSLENQIKTILRILA